MTARSCVSIKAKCARSGWLARVLRIRASASRPGPLCRPPIRPSSGETAPAPAAPPRKSDARVGKNAQTRVSTTRAFHLRILNCYQARLPGPPPRGPKSLGTHARGSAEADPECAPIPPHVMPASDDRRAKPLDRRSLEHDSCAIALFVPDGAGPPLTAAWTRRARLRARCPPAHRTARPHGDAHRDRRRGIQPKHIDRLRRVRARAMLRRRPAEGAPPCLGSRVHPRRGTQNPRRPASA